MSKKPKVTPWFSMAVDPVRHGVYQHRDFEDDIFYSMWNGEVWMSNSGNPETASTATMKSVAAYAFGEITGWRGLAEKP